MKAKSKTVKLTVKTVKRLAILIVVLSLVGGTSVYTQQLQLQRLGRKELAKAKLFAKNGNFSEAETRFGQYLQIFPDNMEVKIQYANALLKGPKSPHRQSTVLQLYDEILRRNRHDDVRRLRAKLKIDMQQFVSNPGTESGADVDLDILMKSLPDDGELFYLKGRCDEEGSDRDSTEAIAKAIANAVSAYRKAIELKAPQKIEASRRLAMLLHDKLDQPKEADQVIESLVAGDPENYQVYLARGRYRLALTARDQSQKSLLLAAKTDFEKAIQKAPKEPEAYLELALVIGNEWKSKTDEARQWSLRLMPSVKDVTGIPTAGKSLMIVAVVDQVLHFRGFDSDGKMVVDTDEKKLPEETQRIEDLRKQFKTLQPPHEIVTNEKDRVISAVIPIVAYTQIRRILEEGEKNAPKATEIYVALANLELRARGADKAIEVLESGIKSATDQGKLRLLLTDLLIQRGDTSTLRSQIEELKKLGYSPGYTQFLTACYHINAKEFFRARQLLQTLPVFSDLTFRTKVSELLALCHGHLGEPEMQQAVLLRAVSADPQNVNARLAWIVNMLSQGDTDGAIKEYRLLVDREPGVRLALARLLIAQNQRRPESQRNWNEVKELIKQAAEASPESIELVVLRAGLLSAQGDQAAAHDELEKARMRFPKSVEIGIAQANLMGLQGRVIEALTLIDQLQQQLGDSVELRLARAGLWASKKERGPEVVKALVDLGEDVEKFSKTDRKRLLNGLAIQLIGQQNLEEAKRLWTRLADEDSNNLELRLNLLDLALQIDHNDESEKDNDKIEKKIKDEIEKNIKQIKAIEGNEELQGLRCQVQYLIWQAKQSNYKAERAFEQAKRASDKAERAFEQAKGASDKADRESALAKGASDKADRESALAKGASYKADRTSKQHQAREILTELTTRRGDWSVIPLALADLEEQELEDLVKQSSVKEEEIKAKEETIIGHYLQAIKLGRHQSAIVRRTVDLLFKNGRGSSALDLIASIPVASQLAAELGRQAAKIALDNHDFQRSEQIARKAVEARPDNFQERMWLVHILLADKRQDDARKELRKAVDLSPSDPDRWIALTRFMLFTKQPESEVAKVVQEAEKKLPPSRAPMALAECCEIIGRAFDNTASETAVKKWNDAARKWYQQAQDAQPEDLSIKRRLTEFLLRSNQMSDAENYLIEMRQGGNAKNAEIRAWATRALALVLTSRADRAQQLSKALALFEPGGKPAAPGQEGKTVRDPEDLRVLARLLDVPTPPVYRKRAIEILEKLTDKNSASSEDRFWLARLYDATGDWPKARLKYRELNLKTRNSKDMETLSRRPFYLAQYASSLLQHRTPDDKDDLNEAQELVDDIKALQPDALGTLALQVEIYRAGKQIDQAVKLIGAFAVRPNLTPQVLESLADLAEHMQQFDLSEQLRTRLAAPPGEVQGKLLLARFLGRREHTDRALNICEPLWTSVPEVQIVGITCIDILFRSDTPTPKQVNRVAGWFERAITQSQNQHRPNPWLFVGLGNLRERQGDYQKAEELYHRAINEGERTGLSLNNLAWLTALKKDGKAKEALVYANQAVVIRSDHPDFLDTRGVIFLKAGDPQQALTDLLRAVEIDPSSPSKLFHLAQAQLANKDKENARQSLEKAKTKGLTPNSLHALERHDYQEWLNKLGPY